MEKMYPAKNKVTLLSPQTEEVWEAVGRSGSAYTRREHIEQKYGDCADSAKKVGPEMSMHLRAVLVSSGLT